MAKKVDISMKPGNAIMVLALMRIMLQENERRQQAPAWLRDIVEELQSEAELKIIGDEAIAADLQAKQMSAESEQMEMMAILKKSWS